MDRVLFDHKRLDCLRHPLDPLERMSRSNANIRALARSDVNDFILPLAEVFNPYFRRKRILVNPSIHQREPAFENSHKAVMKQYVFVKLKLRQTTV